MITKTDKASIFEVCSGPVGESIDCGPEEVAVVAQAGVIQQTLPPGRHALTVPDAEIYVVRTTPIMGFRGGGQIGDMLMKGLLVTPRVMFEYGLRVIDAAKLARSVMGQTLDTAAMGGWTSGRILDAIKTVVGRSESIVVGPGVMADVIEASRHELEAMGLAVTQFSVLEIKLSDEDRAHLAAIAKPAPAAAGPAIGTRVSVVWTDGNRYPGTIRQFQNGYVEIVWDNQSAAWVLPSQIQPA